MESDIKKDPEEWYTQNHDKSKTQETPCVPHCISISFPFPCTLRERERKTIYDFWKIRNISPRNFENFYRQAINPSASFRNVLNLSNITE